MSDFETDFATALGELEDIVKRVTDERGPKFTALLQEQLGSITQAVNSLDSVSDDIISFISNAVQTLNRASNEVEASDIKLNEKKAENARLASEMETQLQAAEAFRIASQQEREKFINDTEEQIQIQVQRMDDEIKAIQELKNKSDKEKADMISSLTAQIEAMTQDYEAQLAAKEGAKEKLKEKMKTANEELKQQLQAEINALNITIEQEKANVKHNEELLADLRDNHIKLQEKMRLLETEAQTLSDASLELKDQIQELDKLKNKNTAEIQALQDQNMEQLLSTATQVESLQAQIDTLKADNARMMTAIKNGTISIKTVVELLKQLDETQSSDVADATRLNEEIKNQIEREMSIVAKLVSKMNEDTGDGNTGDGQDFLPPPPTVTAKKSKGSRLAQKVDTSNILGSERTKIPVDPTKTKTNHGGGTRKRHRSRRCRTKRKRNQKKRKATRRKRRKQRGGYTYKTSV